MPVFRIVYIDDETFLPRTLTVAFPNRAAVEIAMARHGHRVVHIAELGVGEGAADPIKIPIVGASGEREPRAEREPATWPRLGLPRYDLAGAVVVAVGVALAGAAYFLF